MGAIERIDRIDQGVLRFLTAGSVDDGKSTLIGRLRLEGNPCRPAGGVERTSRQRLDLDLSLLTDGLVAEREQGMRSTSRIATSRCRGASSSSPTRRDTSNTRATWSRRRAPRNWRCCSSTRGTASSRRRSAMQRSRISSASAPRYRRQQDGRRRLSADAYAAIVGHSGSLPTTRAYQPRSTRCRSQRCMAT
jgi:hypothetical protein